MTEISILRLRRLRKHLAAERARRIKRIAYARQRRARREAVTVERLERAAALCAYLVVRDGPVAVPLFQRIKGELEALRSREGQLRRASSR